MRISAVLQAQHMAVFVQQDRQHVHLADCDAARLGLPDVGIGRGQEIVGVVERRGVDVPAVAGGVQVQRNGSLILDSYGLTSQIGKRHRSFKQTCQAVRQRDQPRPGSQIDCTALDQQGVQAHVKWERHTSACCTRAIGSGRHHTNRIPDQIGDTVNSDGDSRSVVTLKSGLRLVGKSSLRAAARDRDTASRWRRLHSG